MPAPTDLLDADIKELRESVTRMGQEISRRIDTLTEQGNERHIEMVRRFERLDAKFDNFSGLSKWGVNLAFPIVIAILGSAITAAWYAGGLNARLTQIEGQTRPPAATAK